MKTKIKRMTGKTSRLLLYFLVSMLFYQNATSQTLEGYSIENTGKHLVKDLLSRTEFMIYETPGVRGIHYAEACTGYGALKFAGILKDSGLLESISSRYNRHLTDKIPNTRNHVDVNVYGILPLELYMQGKGREYLDLGLEMAEGQWKDTLSNGLSSQTRYWIDDMYMIPVLQVQAFRATGDTVYLDRAAMEVHTYIEKLQQPNGLFFHGPEAHFFWGRGNGWVAAGLAELLSVLPESNRHFSPILEGYVKMMKALLGFQSEEGMWHQLIDHPESFKESSSTAMFGFAFDLGVKKGHLKKRSFEQAIEKAWRALNSRIDENGKISDICVGTGQSQDINYYLNRPKVTGDLHGQAPALWFCNSLMNGYGDQIKKTFANDEK